mmetsp:Transcript_115007/g.228938  ORF Transcript_115007/g.228938 Transcript_115007/m.228938 type:complete len:201 (-) Transcript_115007:43-645(-)
MQLQRPRLALAPRVVRMALKVGIDEYVAVGKQRGLTLWTSGLSGCVAVVITTQESAFLAHIMDFTRAHRDGAAPQPELYMRALNAAIFQFVDDVRDVTGVDVVIGDPMMTNQCIEVTDQLARSLNGTAVNQRLDTSAIQVLPDPGGGWLIQPIVSPDPAPDPGQNYDSENIAGLEEQNPVCLLGFFPNKEAGRAARPGDD